jgi:hypothetical protein
MTQCWKCHKTTEDLPLKIPFKAECEHCGVWLHVCVNCKFHNPSMHNQCSLPNTEMVSDRTNRNFCDEFQIKKETEPKALGSKGMFENLFKD